MKISQEVREFGRMQEQAADASSLSLDGRGQGEGDAATSTTLEEALAGMAEMRERYRERGGLYVPAAE